MQTGPVTIDGGDAWEAQYDPAVRWNGWLCPYFDRSNAEAVAAWASVSPEYVFEWEGDDLYMTDMRGEDDADPVREHCGPHAEGPGKGLYSIGSFAWVWSAAS